MEKQMENIKKLIENFKATTNTYKENKELFLWCIDNMDNLLTRENEQFHFTSTAFITNKNHDKILLIFHNIYQAWCMPGGHADGENDLLSVAKRECFEETGLNDFTVLNNNSPISIEKLLVDQHFKNDKLVYEHYHLNTTFLFEADENATLTSKPDENAGAKWFTLEDFVQMMQEDNMYDYYLQILKKVKSLSR